MSVVYGLIDGDTLELRYVGQTVGPLSKRFRQHGYGAKNKHLKNWLQARPVNIITLEREPEDLDAAEIKWIAGMRAQGTRLLNVLNGGNGWRFGQNRSAENKAKISAAMLGKHNARGFVQTPETRAKMSAGHRGLHHSPETRAKMSLAHMRQSIK
jgi:hypothetical protein